MHLIKNNLREYDLVNHYWHVSSIKRFTNIEVHQLDNDLKYFCCLKCQANIIGYQVINSPTENYIAYDRTKLRIDYE